MKEFFTNVLNDPAVLSATTALITIVLGVVIRHFELRYKDKKEDS